MHNIPIEETENEINFFSEETEFQFEKSEFFSRLFAYFESTEQTPIGALNYIFVSDAYLLKMNQDFLSHDYFTDVITFDYTEGEILSGDVFISVDTVAKNAGEYQVDFENELFRVMIHGLLHLAGYDDKSEEEQKIMRSKEDFYLNFLLSNYN